MKDLSIGSSTVSAPPTYEGATKSSSDETTLGQMLARRRATRIKQVIDDHIIPAIWEKCLDGVSEMVISLDLLADTSAGKPGCISLPFKSLFAD